MSDVEAPEDIGQPRFELHMSAAEAEKLPTALRGVRALIVGLFFSILPVALTSVILTRDSPRFTPTALMAAFPVVATAYWLLRPRDRWYAVGDQGMALGEMYFGQVRWDSVRYAQVESVDIVLLNEGARCRFIFGQGRKRIELEGRIASSGLPQADRPSDEVLDAVPELRVARAAERAWTEATDRTATVQRR